MLAGWHRFGGEKYGTLRGGAKTLRTWGLLLPLQLSTVSVDLPHKFVLICHPPICCTLARHGDSHGMSTHMQPGPLQSDLRSTFAWQQSHLRGVPKALSWRPEAKRFQVAGVDPRSPAGRWNQEQQASFADFVLISLARKRKTHWKLIHSWCWEQIFIQRLVSDA